MPSRIVPQPVAPGACIAIVAPASSPTAEQQAFAIENLEQAGYRPKVYRPLSEPVDYLSGTDEVRAAELMQAFTDEEVDAVFAARGGYGVARLLDRLDFDVIRANPKVLVGYSDLTALHAALDRRAGLVSYHSPNAIDGLCGGGKLDAPSVKAFWQAVASHDQYEPPAHETDAQLQTISPGVAEGELVGGNLAVLAGIVGGQYEPDFRGRVLLLEDLDEAPYRIDRMLAQLKLAGRLGELAGVVLGQFTNCDPPDGKGPTAADVLREYLQPLGVPVLAGYPTGHTVPNLTLPHAARVRLDASARRLTVLERSGG